MKPESKQHAKRRRRAIWYNQSVNVFWSVLSLAPLVYFCSTGMPLRWVIILGLFSFLTGFLPRSFFDRIRLGNTTAIYHKIGIRTIRKFTQDGDWVNGLLRSRFADYKEVTPTASVKKHLRKAAVNERFHFMLFVFFLGATGCALLEGRIGWTAFLVISNLLYNVYPILLQQYNRLRLNRLLGRSSTDLPPATR